MSMTTDPGSVVCPFCMVPPGQQCETRATGRPLRHRKYHPARHAAVGAPEPSMELKPAEAEEGYAPLDLERVRASWSHDEADRGPMEPINEETDTW